MEQWITKLSGGGAQLILTTIVVVSAYFFIKYVWPRLMKQADDAEKRAGEMAHASEKSRKEDIEKFTALANSLIEANKKLSDINEAQASRFAVALKQISDANAKSNEKSFKVLADALALRDKNNRQQQ